MEEKYTDIWVDSQFVGRMLGDVQVIETNSPVIKGVMEIKVEDSFNFPGLSFDLEIRKMSAEGRMWDRIVLPMTVNQFSVFGDKLTLRYQYTGPMRVGSYRTF